MSKYYTLNWTKTGWSHDSGVVHSMKFETLEEIKNVMSSCFYNGETVKDDQGNTIEMDWASICP